MRQARPHGLDGRVGGTTAEDNAPLVATEGDADGARPHDRPQQNRGVVFCSGLHTIAPKPEVVLPAIEAEVERLKATPGSRRRQRTSNEEKDVAVKAVQAAYGALTGRLGGRVIGADGRPAGRLHRLGRDIDAIFGTRLFPEKDSRRLRRPH